MSFALGLVLNGVVGFLAGYFWQRWYLRRVAKEALAATGVSENAAKYRAAMDSLPEQYGYYRPLTDEQVGRIWAAVQKSAPCDGECGGACDRFVEWRKSQGRLQ